MSTAGPNSSGTITSDSSSGGTIVWVNPSNAGASDNTYATSSVTTTDHFSYFLNCQNFGFAVTAGSTINGIQVDVERSNVAGGQVNDNEWYLIKAGSVIPTFPGTGSTKTAFPGADAYITYGSASDLWGSAWAATDINSSGFGFALDVVWVSGTPVARVDHVRITITYTVPASGYIRLPLLGVGLINTLIHGLTLGLCSWRWRPFTRTQTRTAGVMA